jgi:hypothetical protein
LYSIFQNGWWLDAVAPRQWDEVVVKEGSQIVARLPYTVRHRRGFTCLEMPSLTQTLGPWIAPHEAKYTNLISRQHKLMAALIAQLPDFDLFQQNFHHSVTNWLPFYWQGFQQTTRYTYLIDDLSNLDLIWRETRENIKREIRKAQTKLSVRTDLDTTKFLDLNEMTFKRQGMQLPYPRDLVERIDHACAARCCRQVFFAEDSQGQLHAAVYIVWDEHAAYYLMGGSDPELRNSGATSLLIWAAIQHASKVTKAFDFEGSMLEPIERFFRAFGAKQIPYLSISKITSPLLRVRRDIKEWIRLIRHK